MRLAAQVPELQRRLREVERLSKGKEMPVDFDEESMTSFCPDAECDEEDEEKDADPEPTDPTNNKVRMVDISRGKVTSITERKLDLQTTEYYKFGCSTWDLAIFVGAGLGPLGSLRDRWGHCRPCSWH